MCIRDSDAAGKLYVFDGLITAEGPGTPHYVRVYAAGVQGDAVPLKSYTVNTKCWLNAP